VVQATLMSNHRPMWRLANLAEQQGAREVSV